MSDENSELAPSVWLKRIRLLDERLASDEADVESALRHAFHLSQLAPRPFDAVIGDPPDEAEFEERLDAGKYVEAAIALAQSPALEFEVVIPDGHAIAKLSSAIFDVSASAKAVHEEKAVLQAWLRLMMKIAEQSPDETLKFQHPALRKRQSGQRPPLSEH